MRFRSTPLLCALSAATASLIAEMPAAAQIFSVTPGPYSVFVPSPTPADQRDRTGPIGVLQRPRLELEPLGFRVEGARVVPSATATSIYDSNIFAAQTNPSGDVILHLRPELNVDNGRSLVSYNFNTYVDSARYLSHGSLDYTNFGTSLGVVGDLSQTFRVESRTNFVRDHLDPASFVLPAANGTVSHLPTSQSFNQQLSAIRDIGRWGLALSGGYSRSDFEDITINGVTFRQSLLNANVFNVAPRVTYDITPLLRGLFRTEYRHESDAEGSFSSTTYTVATGADFQFRGLIRGTVTVGYAEHVPDVSSFSKVGSPTYGINLAWYPTEIMTVTLTGKQDFSSSIVTSAGGTPAVADVKTVQTQVDLEVLRQVLLSGVVSYETDNYQTTSRRDSVASAGINLLYNIDRNWVASGQYRFVSRGSTQAGFSYDRHQVGVALRLEY